MRSGRVHLAHLLAAGVVLGAALAGCGDDQESAGPSTGTETPTASESASTGSESASSDAETPAQTRDWPTLKQAKAAPTDAPLKLFCKAFAKKPDDPAKEADYAWDRMKVGTPAAMPKLARKGFVQSVSGMKSTDPKYVFEAEGAETDYVFANCM